MAFTTEKQLAEDILKPGGWRAAQLGLRFDKVVVRLLGNLRTYTEPALSKGETIIITITAPIKHPAKTECELQEHIQNILRSKSHDRDFSSIVFQNQIRIRLTRPSSKRSGKFIGFVHNPDADSKILLDLATQYVIKG